MLIDDNYDYDDNGEDDGSDNDNGDDNEEDDDNDEMVMMMLIIDNGIYADYGDW